MQSKRSDQQLSDYCQTNDKLALYLSVNVFSTKVLIGDIIFTPSTGDGATIQFVIRATRRSSRLQWKGVPLFLSYFKFLSLLFKSNFLDNSLFTF